jgi:hypothetical protein
VRLRPSRWRTAMMETFCIREGGFELAKYEPGLQSALDPPFHWLENEKEH